MNNFCKYILSAAVLLGPACLVSAALNLEAIEEPLEWRFRVYLDEKEIGWHAFRLAPDGARLVMDTEAQFDVKFFFITAYRYRHQCTETWDADGLLSIDAFTDANGDEQEVRGERGEGYFRLFEDGEAIQLPIGLKSFCYWSPAIVEESRLLNSQTGEYETVDVVDRGISVVAYGGEEIPARQYDIMVQGSPISVWYSVVDNRWLALESITEGGRLIRYEPERLPEQVPLKTGLRTGNL